PACRQADARSRARTAPGAAPLRAHGPARVRDHHPRRRERRGASVDPSLAVIGTARAAADAHGHQQARRPVAQRRPRRNRAPPGRVLRASLFGASTLRVRIEQAEVVPYALPFREPYVTARGRLERRELVLLRLRTDGLEGLGEAAPLSLRGGAPLGAIVAELEEACRPVLEGADLRGDGVVALLERCLEAGVSPPVLAAVELALLDLVGKKSRRPVWRLLGVRRARPVERNPTLVAGPPQEVAAAATRWAERGSPTFH